MEFQSASISDPVQQVLGQKVCPRCALPIVFDQRYCLECGARAGEARIPVANPTNSISPSSTSAPRDPRNHDWTPQMLAGAVGALVCSALIGGLIAAGLQPEPRQVQAAAPQIIQTAAPVAAPLSASEGAVVPTDWPEGETGWTVALSRFEKETVDVAQLNGVKSQADRAGLTPGVLDAEEFASLDSTEYVVYSGIFAKKAAAKKRLAKARKAGFDDAELIEVNEDADGDKPSTKGATKVDRSKLEALEKLSREDPEKAAKQRLKLPDKTALPGKPPPKDDKEPGDGSDVTEIG